MKTFRSILTEMSHRCTKCHKVECTCKKIKTEAVTPTADDHDTHMTISLLKSTVMNAQRLLGMIQSDDELPEWCHSKITLAQDYIDTVTNYMEANVNEQTNINELFGMGKKKTPEETPQARLGRLSNHANLESEWANQVKAHPDASKFHDERYHDDLVDKGYVDPEQARGMHWGAQQAHHEAAHEALKQENYELAKHHVKWAEKHGKEADRINANCSW